MAYGAGEMAPLVKCLLCKHEDLSLDPQHSHKKPGMVVHVCNPRTQAVKTEGS